jgi:L-threonylcarbamoyladenylate synthase
MINKKTEESIRKAAEYIQEGKVVAFPTETVYGLGANALNPLAVAKIYELKERPSFDPLIVHIADLTDIEKLTASKDERVQRLAEKFWPGPLTIVLPRSSIVPEIVTSGLNSVGIRMPANEIALQLIKVSGCPIAAPSANKFGRISPTIADHVRKQIAAVDYIIDGGKTSVGIESTIIELTPKGFRILRNGIITADELATVLPHDTTEAKDEIAAPGMLKSHYSPNKKICIVSAGKLSGVDTSKAGLLSFTGKYDHYFDKVITMSQRNDLKDYAVNLFEAMHTFEDDDTIDIIIAEPVPEQGIGKAIMDRLRKAAFNWGSC